MFDPMDFNKADMIDKDDLKDLPQIDVEETEVIFNDDVNMDIVSDYQYSRKKLTKMIETCEAVMRHALKDMVKDPGPRQVESFSSLIKVMNDTTTQLLNLHEKYKKIDVKKEPTDSIDKPKTIKATVNDVIDGMNK